MKGGLAPPFVSQLAEWVQGRRGELRDTLAVVFEGGQALTEVERAMASVREEICLDTLERLTSAPSVDRVLLVTSSPRLAEPASRLGVDCEQATREGFHFGRHLAGVIARRKPDSVICLGGVSAPLARACDFDAIARRLKDCDNLVVANNLLSSDVVGFRPADAINRISLPETDNFLAYLLAECGLNPEILPDGPRFGLDIDTPLDLAILSLHPDAGRRAMACCRRAGWGNESIERVFQRLRTEHPRVFVTGRVGPAVMEHIKANLRWRLRVVSEERGLKATNPGDVRSITGALVDAMGDKGFFDYVADICDVALFDTRILFAHWGLDPAASDRFNSDLGDLHRIGDERIRAFTAEALRCRSPVLFGGHSLVNAGLWIMADRLLQELTGSSRIFP